MGILGWLILLVVAAALATVTQFVFFRNDRKPTDYDWIYVAAGALIGGFTANVWYGGSGPVVDGLYLLPTLAGAVVLGAVVELVYRLLLRQRRTA